MVFRLDQKIRTGAEEGSKFVLEIGILDPNPFVLDLRFLGEFG
jgi:hypothetical protein